MKKVYIVVAYTMWLSFVYPQHWVERTSTGVKKNVPSTIDSLTITFSHQIDPASLNQNTIVIHGLKKGYYKAEQIEYRKEERSAILRFQKPFFAEDHIQVSVTTGIRDTSQKNMPAPYTWILHTTASKKSSGEFTPTMFWRYPQFNAFFIRLSDLNNDGFLDIIVSATMSGGIAVLFNRSGFEFKPPVWLSGSAFSNQYLNIADYDADGDMDIIHSNELTNDLLIFYNNGKGEFPDYKTIMKASNGRRFGTADLNGDGLMDLVNFQGYGDSFGIYLNSGSGNLLKYSEIPIAKYCADGALGDFDDNGTIDIVLSAYNVQDQGSARTSFFYFFSNDGNGNFTKKSEMPFSGNLETVSTGDYDNDGDLDALGSNTTLLGALLMENTGDWNFKHVKTIPQKNNIDYTQFSDINGDGFLDIIAVDDIYFPGSFSIHQNDGTGNYQWTKIDMLTTSTRGLDAGDINGDGSMDIVNTGNPFITVFMDKNNPSVSVNADKSIIPKQWFILKNYPNPFNAATTFEYHLPFRSDVVVSVYDLLGREVSRLKDERQEGGQYRLFWDASKQSSGVYIAKLLAGGNTSIIKLLLVK